MKYKLLELGYLKNEQFPKGVVDAYAKMIRAEKLFEKAKKELAPEAPFEKGEFVLLDRWNENVWIEGRIAYVKYEPYSNLKRVGSWSVCFLPLRKNFTEFNRVTVNTIKITNEMRVKKVIS